MHMRIRFDVCDTWVLYLNVHILFLMCGTHMLYIYICVCVCEEYLCVCVKDCVRETDVCGCVFVLPCVSGRI